VRLLAKEGLSLINGTQFMAAQGALALVRAQRLMRVTDVACALSLEALQGSRNSFIPQVHALRPLRGQGASARNVMRLLEDSAIIESHRWCDKVQDAYSLRCAPQVHGASRDLLDYVEYTVGTELNAATDNPLVLVEDELLVSMIMVATLISILIDFSSVSPIQMLVYSAAFNALLAPPLLVLILFISNNQKIMGAHTNSSLSNVLGVDGVKLEPFRASISTVSSAHLSALSPAGGCVLRRKCSNSDCKLK